MYAEVVSPNGESAEPNVSGSPSKTAEATPVPTEDALQKPGQPLPKAETYAAKDEPETPTQTSDKSLGVRILSKSFHALTTVLGMSMITKSFHKSKSVIPERMDSELLGRVTSDWADIVDVVVESDVENESMDSYVEFMGRRRFALSSRGFGRKKRQRLEIFERNESANDASDGDGSVPWFPKTE